MATESSYIGRTRRPFCTTGCTMARDTSHRRQNSTSYEYRRRIRYVNTKIWTLIYNIPIVGDFIWTACKLLIPRIFTSQAHPLWIWLHDEGAFYVIRWYHVTYQGVYHTFLELGIAHSTLSHVNATACTLWMRSGGVETDGTGIGSAG